MTRLSWFIIVLALVACGRDSSGNRARGPNAAERRIGPLPTDTLMAALEDFKAKRITADSAAAIVAGYQQRTGRTVNVEMDAEILAALQRREQRRVP